MMCVCILYIASEITVQERPYSNENTASRLLSEVKHCLVQLVLRWGTTLESWMLFFCFSHIHETNIISYLLLQASVLDDIDPIRTTVGNHVRIMHALL